MSMDLAKKTYSTTPDYFIAGTTVGIVTAAKEASAAIAAHVELEWLRNLVRMAADKDLCGAKFAPPLSMHQYETWARYNTEIGCLLGKYIASVKK